MRKYNLRITELAEQDLEDIGDYIAFELNNPDSAVRTMREIRKEMTSLSNLPERHELDEDDDLASLGIRKCYFKNYKIYYMIHQQTATVIILRILHMRVDSRAKLYRLFGI